MHALLLLLPNYLQEKYGINVNCVVPVAASRMTETVLPPDMLKLLHPKHVVPLVVYLAHEKSTHTGDCYEIGGGWYSKVIMSTLN